MNINHHQHDLWPFLAWLPFTFPLSCPLPCSCCFGIHLLFSVLQLLIDPVNLSFSPFPFTLSHVSKSAHVCQSHFRSVSCFNLLNLFSPKLSDSVLYHVECLSPHRVWYGWPFHPILCPTNHLFWCSHLSLFLSHRAVSSPSASSLLWAQIRKGIITL